MELAAYPVDNQVVAANPPGFRWTPNDRTTAYRVEITTVNAHPKTILISDPLTSTVYAPAYKLAPGQYNWRVQYLDERKVALGASRWRRFTVPDGVPELAMPDVSALKQRVVAIRPRLFLAGDRLDRIRSAVAVGNVRSWARLRETADVALAEPLYPEPAPYDPAASADAEWLRTFTPAKVASANLARTALAYKITGDVRYLQTARRLLLHLASWNPKGITSHGLKQPDGGIGNDEASMPMLERMAMAWDWIGDCLTAEERAKVLASIRERGNQVLRKLQADDFLSHPFNNHSGRVLAFLGEAGLSFLGEVPEADDWLGYVLRCYLTSYPSWAGDEGGWSQGLSYWSFYVFNQTNFAEALRQITEIDLLRQPFYRNTGYFGVYFHPPYSPVGGFGDGGYHRPNELEALLIDFLAQVNHDPVLKWQAEEIRKRGEQNTTRWREWFMEDVISTLRAADDTVLAPEPPSRLAPSRYSPDIGWVAMHSALGDSANDVWALFKSSRFGSFSHSHADQNTFQLNAYGRALAIDSGYYPSYGTPHDNLWTRQTAAHNGILVSGRGQPVHTWEATGRIEGYQTDGVFTLARGEAAEAYNLDQPSFVAELWKKLMPQPPPLMESRVETFARTVAFVASRKRPVLVVSDLLRTSAPAKFDWLLHTLHQMQIDSSKSAVLVSEGDARMAVRLVATIPFEFAQTCAFPIPPEAPTNTAYVLGEAAFSDQWHLRASTTRPAREIQFLAVLIPFRASEAEPSIQVFERQGDKGFRIGGFEVTAQWGRSKSRPRLALRLEEDGQVHTATSH